MGDAADDLFDAGLRRYEVAAAMSDAGAIPCPNCRVCRWLADIECPVCHDLGWLDKNGNPCEP